MKRNTDKTSETVWISANLAERLTGLTRHSMYRAALLGKIRHRAEPGGTIEVVLDEVMALSRECQRGRADRRALTVATGSC